MPSSNDWKLISRRILRWFEHNKVQLVLKVFFYSTVKMVMNVMDVFINELMPTADIITGISGQVEFAMSEREQKIVRIMSWSSEHLWKFLQNLHNFEQLL